MPLDDPEMLTDELVAHGDPQFRPTVFDPRTGGRRLQNLSRPSVSSIYVPYGSVMKAIAMFSPVDFEYGRSSLTPALSSFLQKFSRSFTSKPMWSTARPLVPTTGSGEGDQVKLTPG